MTEPPSGPPQGPPQGPPFGPPPAGPPQGPPSGPPPAGASGPPPATPAGPPPGPPRAASQGPPPGPPRTPAPAPSASPSPGPRPWIATPQGRGVVIGGVLVAIVVVIIVLIAGGNKNNKNNAATNTGSGEIFLQPAASTGDNPFTPSVATQTPPPSTPSAVPSPTGTPSPSPSASAAQALTSYSGSTPGLYGGTRQISSCNKEQLVSFLQANPDKAQAWAGVEGIATSEIPSYVAGLTPVLLRADTRVTNHGFENGQATTYQAVLEAGTAVLVDAYGVPRARCYCGNPLTPPVALTQTPTYTGPKWPKFTPTTIVVIAPAPQPQTQIIIVDVSNGTAFARPVGGTGATDTNAPPGTFTTPTPIPTPTPSASPAGGVPDLTGSWINPASPDSPPWILQPSSDHRTMSGSWQGSGGHSTLRGTFHADLNQGGTAYVGTMEVTESGASPVSGVITFTIVSPTHLSVTYRQENGPNGTFDLTLPASASASPSPSP